MNDEPITPEPEPTTPDDPGTPDLDMGARTPLSEPRPETAMLIHLAELILESDEIQPQPAVVVFRPHPDEDDPEVPSRPVAVFRVPEMLIERSKDHQTAFARALTLAVALFRGTGGALVVDSYMEHLPEDAFPPEMSRAEALAIYRREHGWERKTLQQRREEGDMSIKDAFTITFLDLESGALELASVAYTLDDHGKRVIDEVVTYGGSSEDEHIEGYLASLIRRARLAHGHGQRLVETLAEVAEDEGVDPPNGCEMDLLLARVMHGVLGVEVTLGWTPEEIFAAYRSLYEKEPGSLDDILYPKLAPGERPADSLPKHFRTLAERALENLPPSEERPAEPFKEAPWLH